MKLNENFKQITVRESYGDYDSLKGKVIDKVAFTNYGDTDDNIFVLTFSDNTFISLGVGYGDDDFKEPLLENNFIMAPQNINGGNYACHCHINGDGKVKFDKWIEILRDLGIWELSEEETLKIIEYDKKKQEEREYSEYLRLKEKFEK